MNLEVYLGKDKKPAIIPSEEIANYTELLRGLKLKTEEIEGLTIQIKFFNGQIFDRREAYYGGNIGHKHLIFINTHQFASYSESVGLCMDVCGLVGLHMIVAHEIGHLSYQILALREGKPMRRQSHTSACLHIPNNDERERQEAHCITIGQENIHLFLGRCIFNCFRDDVNDLKSFLSPKEVHNEVSF